MLILHTTQATPNLCPFVISAIWGCNWSSMSQIRTDGMWPLWKQHNKKVTTDTESYLGTDHLTSDCGQGKTFVKESTFLFFYNLKKIHNNLLHPLQGVRRIPKGTVPPLPPPPPPKKNRLPESNVNLLPSYWIFNFSKPSRDCRWWEVLLQVANFSSYCLIRKTLRLNWEGGFVEDLW